MHSNAYIDKPGLFIKVTGNPKKQKEITFPDNHHLAFKYAGLKVIFALVRAPELIQKPYRKIAEAAGLANGAVTWVIKGLKETGFMGETDNGERWLRAIPKLVERMNALCSLPVVFSATENDRFQQILLKNSYFLKNAIFWGIEMHYLP